MPSSFGRQHVSPVISRFLRRYPGVSVDLRLTDQVIDLVDAGIGVGDPSWRTERFVAGGAPARGQPARVVRGAFLPRERGTPHHPSDLAQHECIILSDQRDWAFRTPARDGSACA